MRLFYLLNKALLQGGARDFPKPELWLLVQAPKQKGLIKGEIIK